MSVFPNDVAHRPRHARRRAAGAWRFVLSSLLTLVLGVGGVFVTAGPASAAPVLSITPITWNVVGLDSNKPTQEGPDTFASGARVCNTGNATATNVVSNYVWDTANVYINSTGLTTLSVPSLAAGACTDFYYNIVITRNAAAFNTTRQFHITATADALGTVSTPTPREIYVEHLVSQNRNSIDSVTGPSNVVVGNTYTYVLTSSTSSSYEQWSSFLNFPNFAFQIVSVSATYTQPAGSTNSTIYADACGFQQNPTLPNYRTCVGPPNYAGGTVGGTAVTTYQVKILSSGAFTMNALIFDKSGGSYHYNSDWNNGGQAITATEQVDLSLTKTDSVDPVTAGNDLTYTMTASNAGPSTAHNVTISDPIPAGTTFVSASNGGTVTAGTASWTIGDIAAGSSVQRTLTVHVNSNRTAALSNTATATTTTTDTNAANNSATQATTVATSADVSVTKTDVADPVGAGSNVTYTLTASNAGPSDAQSVSISDPLPAGVNFVSATPSQGTCSQAAGTVSCPLGTIASGSSATVSVVVSTTIDGALSNTASVSSTTSDPVPANNSATQGTTVNPRVDVSITKTDGVDPVTAGTDLTYTLTASNAGPSTAQNVQISDPLPTGTTFVSASNGGGVAGGTVTWPTVTLASGANVVRTLTVHVNASRTSALSNTATVSTTTTDTNAANDTSTQGTTVATSADVSLTKTDDVDPIAVGSNLTYTLTASNAGPSDALSVSISDPVPAGVTFVSATPSQGTCSVAAGTITCPVGTIASGANATVSVVVTPTSSGALSNSASVSSSTSDPVPANNSATQATTVNAVADVSITKTDSVDPVTAGNDLTYTLTASNAGPSTASNVQITDAIPAGTTFVSASGGGVLAAGTVTWSVGSIASGANAARTLTVHVVSSRTSGLSNTAQVTSTTNDPTPANNSATQPTAVATSADLSLTKTDAADPVALGSNVTYTITVNDAGPSDATAVQVSDPLPAGVTFVSATPSQGSCSQLAGTVTCPLGTVASGANATITVVVTPTSNGSLSNTATVSSTTSDPDHSNDQDTESTSVTPVADLAVTKTDAAATVVAGTSTTYAITLTNNGPSAIPAGVAVTDAIPAGVVASESEADCGIAAGTVTCTTSTGLAVGASAVYHVQLAVDDGYAPATLTNTATISSSPYADTVGGNDSASDVDLVTHDADLSVGVVDDADPVALGNDVTYTFTIDNAGPSTADTVVAAAAIPAGMTFVGADPGCAVAFGIVTCSVASMPVGGSATFDVVLHPTTAGLKSVTVGVSSATPDSNPGNDSDTETTTITDSADVSLTKTDDVDPIAAGSNLTYTLTVHDAGPSDAANVQVVDVLPAGMTYVSATPSQGTCSELAGTVTCDLGAVTAGFDATIDVVVTPTTDGSFVNSATVTTTTDDPDPSDNDASEGTDVTPVADLEITKDDGLVSVVAGTTTTYTITIANQGPNVVPAGVVVTDTLPGSVTANETEAECDISGGVLTCTTSSPIASGASVDFDLDVTLDASYAGANLSNTAAIASSPYADDDVSNDSATDVDAVTHDADLSADVVDAPDPVALGGDVTYTFTVQNLGPSDADSVLASAPLPAGTTFVGADPGCVLNAGTIECTIGTLAATGNASFDVVVHPTASGTVTAALHVASATPDTNPANDDDTELTAVTDSADLSITKTDDADPVGAGSDLTYTITVHDAGPSDAANVQVVDPLPAGVVFVSATPSQGTCGEAAGTVTCDLGTVTDGSDATISVVVTTTTNGMLSNTATVSTTTADPDPSDDSDSQDTDVTPVADLEIAKDDGAATVVAGTSTTYTITVTNHGPNDVPAGVLVTDVVPAGVTASSSDPDCGIAGGTLSCTTSSVLSVGNSVTFDVDMAVDASYAGATLSNTAVIASSPYADDDATNDDATDVDAVDTSADVGVIVTDAPDPVILGNGVTYTITVTNDGPSDAQNVVTSSVLPAGLSFVSADPGCAFVAGEVQCTVGTLAPSATATFDVVTAPSATGTVTFPVGVSSTTPDANGANDTDAEDTDVHAPPVTDADLEIQITDLADPVATSAPLDYQVTVTNHGPADAVAVQAVQTLPAGSSFVSATPSQGSCGEVAGTITCALGAIANGASVTIDVSATSPAVGGAVTSNASVSAGSPDPFGANDTDSEDTDVIATLSADLSLTKDDSSATVTAGGWTTYMLTLHNAGPDPVPAGVTITDTFPAGTTGSESELDCSIAAGVLTCTTTAPVAAGGDLVFAVDVSVPADFVGANVTNTAQISSSPVNDPDNSNDASTDDDTVIRRADVSMDVTDTPDPVVLGDDVTYTLTISNAGPSDAAGSVASAPIPAGLTFVSADPGCVVALGTVMCAAGTLAPGASASFDVVLHPTATGSVSLDGLASTSTPDPDSTNDVDTEWTAVLAAPVTDVDVSVGILDAPDPVAENGTLTYSLQVDNAGPADADNVQLTANLPAGVAFVSVTAGCGQAAGVVTCPLGTVNSGASANATVVVTAPASITPLSADATVTTTSHDTNAANDSDVEATTMQALGGGASADLGVTIADAPDPIDVGGTLTYTVGVSNAGPDGSTGTTLSVTLPAGAAFVSATPGQGTCSQAGGVVTCNLGTVLNGGSTSITVVVTPTTEGVASATAVISGAVPDPNNVNDAAIATTAVNPVAELALAKDDGATTVSPGTSTTYTLTLSNAGPSAAATGVVVTDHVPAGTTAHVTDPGCMLVGGDVTCTTTAPLASGASVSWHVTLDVPTTYVGAALDNTAAITSSPTTNPNAANDTATDHDDVVAQADLSIFKDDQPDPVNAGERITYTISVTNNGPGTADQVVVTDPVPADTTIDEIQDGGTEANGVVTWNVGTLANGATETVHVVVLVAASHEGDVTNTATVASATNDPDPSDNSATAVTTDDPAPVDLSLKKTADAKKAEVGDVVTYTIVVSNAGPGDATGVQVKDALPDGLDFVAAHADEGSYDDATGIWDVGDLAADDHATLTLRARITDTAAATETNAVSVAGLDQTDPTPANDEDSVGVDVEGLNIVRDTDPITQGNQDQLAYTGFDFELASEVFLMLLALGIALLLVGRRLERRGRSAS